MVSDLKVKVLYKLCTYLQEMNEVYHSLIITVVTVV